MLQIYEYPTSEEPVEEIRLEYKKAQEHMRDDCIEFKSDTDIAYDNGFAHALRWVFGKEVVEGSK